MAQLAEGRGCESTPNPCCRALRSTSRSWTVRRGVAAFQHVLLVRISQLLITQLQILLDPACEPAAQASVLRIVLRVARTTLQQFFRQLGPRTGVLLEGLLAGGALLARPTAPHYGSGGLCKPKLGRRQRSGGVPTASWCSGPLPACTCSTCHALLASLLRRRPWAHASCRGRLQLELPALAHQLPLLGKPAPRGMPAFS